MVLQNVSNRMIEEANEALVAPLDLDEIKLAVFTNKAPGPDGMKPAFFQKFWGIVGPDVITCCQEWFMQGGQSNRVNDTVIVLIPNKKSCDS